MDKFSFDLGVLDKQINSPKVYRLADVQDRIEKVAFDVVRFKDDDDSTKLWQIEDTPEGKVIVAIYDGSASGEKKSVSEWKAIPDKSAGVQVFHKGEAIVRLALKDYGVDEKDVSIFCRWLPKRLGEDAEFRNSLLKLADEGEEGPEESWAEKAVEEGIDYSMEPSGWDEAPEKSFDLVERIRNFFQTYYHMPADASDEEIFDKIRDLDQAQSRERFREDTKRRTGV